MSALLLAACDPRIERDNPYDPRSDDPLPARISGQVSVATVDGPRPADALVRAIGDDGRLAAQAEGEGFDLEVPAGTYTLTAEAPGHEASALTLVVGIGEVIALDPIVLVDTRAPVAPTLTLPPGPVSAPEIVIRVEHPEPAARVGITLGADVEAVEGEGAERVLRLAPGDGLKRIEAVARDAAGNVSSVAAAQIALDTTPPRPGRLVLAGGAPEVRSQTVSVEVVDTDADRVGFAVTPGACGDACPDDVPCAEPIERIDGLTLAPARGPQCVCWALCDLAGNRVDPPPVDIALGPYQPRPVPVLAAIEPAIVPARASSSPDVALVGEGVAFDTVADIGPFTSLPCALDRPAGGCVAGDPESCATTCTVTLPDALRLTSGRFPARLRTPDPVADGAGLSRDVRWLTLSAPRPLIDRIEPRGVAFGAGLPTAVDVEMTARDLTDSVEISLAGRPPSRLSIERDPGDPDAVRIAATFDLAGLAPDAGHDVVLAVQNPGGDRVELPFGLVPSAFACPDRDTCRVPVRRTRPSGLPGHVAVEIDPPRGAAGLGFAVSGARRWTVLGPDGTPLMRADTGHGLAALRLPGPQPAARLIADVPIEGGGVIELAEQPTAPALSPLCAVDRHDPEVGPASAGLFADLDLDGRAEGLTVHPGTGWLVITGAAPIRVDVGGSPWALAVGDVDGDGRPDVLIGDRATRAITVRRGLGDLTFAAPQPLPAADLGGPIAALAVADVEGDRVPDVLAGFDGADGGLVRWAVYDDGRIGPPEVVDRRPVSTLAALDAGRPGAPEVIYGDPDGLWSWHPGAPPAPLLAGQAPGGAWVEAIGRDRGGVARLMGSDDEGLWTLARAPGDRWRLEGRTPVGADFRGLGVYDPEGEGAPALLGVEVDEAGHHRLRLQRARLPNDLGPVDAEGPPWTPLAVRLRVQGDPVFEVAGDALGADGIRRALVPCDGEPDTPPPPALVIEGGPPIVAGRHAWIDVDRDGRADLVAVDAGRLVTAHGPCVAPDIVCAAHDPPPGDAWWSLAAAPPLDGAPRVVLGTGDRVQIGTLGAAGQVEAVQLELVLSAPALDVLPVRAGGGLMVAALSETAIEVVGSGGVRQRIESGEQALVGLLVADLLPEAGPADEVVAVTAEGLAAWGFDGERWRAVGQAAVPRAITRTLADVDGDGLVDRVDLTSAPGGAAVAVYRGTGDARLFEVDPIAPPLAVGGAAAMAVADVNGDGLADVLVAARGERVESRVLLGRGAGALTRPLEGPVCDLQGLEEPGAGPDPPRGPPVRLALTVAAADLHGDGRPEVVATVGHAVCAGSLASVNPLRGWAGDPAPPAPDADGRVSSALYHPAARVEHVALIAWLDGPGEAVGGRLISPRGDAVELPARAPAGGAVAWTSDDALAAAHGRQPGGDWIVELDVGADGPPVTSVELLFAGRWSSAPPSACIGPDGGWSGGCFGRPPQRRAVPGDDCDGDGVPDLADPCPASARWPEEADRACGRATHLECPP